MPYKLKLNQPDFEMVDGPFAGRKFKANGIYNDVPVSEAHRFQETNIEAGLIPAFIIDDNSGGE